MRKLVIILIISLFTLITVFAEDFDLVKDGTWYGDVDHTGKIVPEDDMEMKILKIMDKDNFKKIVVFNNRTNKREYHYPG